MTVESPSADRSADRVQSVERAVSILEFLARNGWSGVTDVGHELGVHKSTASRMLATLEARGLVEQHISSGKYHLGFGLVHLARAVTIGPDLRRQARPGCEWLADRTQETVTLAILEDDACVTVDQILSTSTIASRSWLGRLTPLHATSNGKVFLASLPASRRSEIVAGPHERFTDHTLVDPVKLRDETEKVSRDGFATTVDEFEDGLSAAAAPVRAADGTVVATIGVSGPSTRLGADRLAEIVELVVEAAAQASAGFGYSHRADG